MASSNGGTSPAAANGTTTGAATPTADPWTSTMLDKYEFYYRLLEENMQSEAFAQSRLVGPEHRIFILGASGAGKSTLIGRLASTHTAAKWQQLMREAAIASTPVQYMPGVQGGNGVSTTKVPIAVPFKDGYAIYECASTLLTRLTDQLQLPN